MEDEHEKQARMQRAALLEQFGPESVAFQFAKSRVDKMVRTSNAAHRAIQIIKLIIEVRHKRTLFNDNARGN